MPPLIGARWKALTRCVPRNFGSGAATSATCACAAKNAEGLEPKISAAAEAQSRKRKGRDMAMILNGPHIVSQPQENEPPAVLVRRALDGRSIARA
jgi:hypothetical protein